MLKVVALTLVFSLASSYSPSPPSLHLSRRSGGSDMGGSLRRGPCAPGGPFAPFSSPSASLEHSAQSSLVLHAEKRLPPNEPSNDPSNELSTKVSKGFLSTLSLSASFLLSFALLTSSPPPSLAASAASYSSFTPRAATVASAWRILDSTYLDRTFNGVDWFQVRQNMLKDTKTPVETQLTDMAAMLGDKYTRYLPPIKYNALVASATGSLTGVGVTLSQVEAGKPLAGYPFIVAVEPSAPAGRAGVARGDILTKVDGTSGADGPDVVAAALRGAAGSRVTFTVDRDGAAKTFDATREKFSITQVLPEKVAGGVIGVKVKQFSSNTASDVEKIVEKAAGKDGVNRVLIDLRDDPGGLLAGGVEAAGLFM